jgi:hypothetical protein
MIMWRYQATVDVLIVVVVVVLVDCPPIILLPIPPVEHKYLIAKL